MALIKDSKNKIEEGVIIVRHDGKHMSEGKYNLLQNELSRN